MNEPPTYEQLRDKIRERPAASTVTERQVQFLDPQRCLAAARDTDGQVELFLIGPELQPTIPALRERLFFDTWEADAGVRLQANRLVLPGGSQFDAAAALICVELLSNGYNLDPEEGFRAAEPVIDLVLMPVSQADWVMSGLAGELTFLDALFEYGSRWSAKEVLEAWHGWDRSARDFQLGPVGVEVKTSTTGASTHHIEGWYQVEPGATFGDGIETTFYLLSLGIRWLPHGSNGPTIETLANRISLKLPGYEREALLDRVGRYCGTALALDPAGRARDKALTRPFMLTFERLYDMADTRIQVPRSADLAPFVHADTNSFKFVIRLPEKVRGDLNPIHGIERIVREVATASCS